MKKIIITFLMAFLMLSLVGCKVMTLEDLGFSSSFQKDLGKELEKYGFTSSYQQEVDERLKSGDWSDLDVDEIVDEIEKQTTTPKKTKKTRIVKNKVIINGEISSQQAQEMYDKYGIEVDPSKIRSDDEQEEIVDDIVIEQESEENSSVETIE